MKRVAFHLLLLTCYFIFTPVVSSAKIMLPSFFSDNMVLQQKTEAAIWGWAKANSTVQLTSSWNKKKYIVQSDQAGKWKLKISTPAGGGPYEIASAMEKQLRSIIY